MKTLLLFLFIITTSAASAQDKRISGLRKYFAKEPNLWTKSFRNFDLSNLKAQDTLKFENNFEQDISGYRSFLSVYKPIITYSGDSSSFIDIYSYQLNLEKKKNYYKANPEIDQAILLYLGKRKYWDRIYFGTSTQWIDEAVWVSATQFILAGIIKDDEDKKRPLVLLGDINMQRLIRFRGADKNIYQSDKGYYSPKLKKIKIRGL